MKKLLMAALILVLTLAVYASSVTLAWDPSPDAGVTGYRIYFGGVTGNYTNSATVGDVTTATIGNLNTNRTYFFAAVAYDSSGVESDFSNEVMFTTPSTNAPGGGTNQPNSKPKAPTGVRSIQP